MSMLITINRKTSMHLFAQNNHGISELFLATLRVERNPKKSENSTDGNQKMTNSNVCQNGLLSRGILCHGWLPVRQTLF